MTKPVKPDLGPVQETLLIPLLARARETERRRGPLRDPSAVELVRRLDYDFEKWVGGRSLKGAMLRARMFDRYVEDFLAIHPPRHRRRDRLRPRHPLRPGRQRPGALVRPGPAGRRRPPATLLPAAAAGVLVWSTSSACSDARSGP
ncbi:MAG: hypothetical protein OXG04_01935 [Acidobacteria bacterium]|nr:hypothetical protein [Acidobacteriota bacterium]